MKSALKTIIKLFLLALGLIWICFLLLYVLPGDPVQNLIGQHADPQTLALLKNELGLDKSLSLQFFTYIKNCLTGNLGYSYTTRLPVTSSILIRLPLTISIAFFAIAIATMLGLLFGVSAALYRDSLIEKLILGFSTLGIAMPVFWTALILLYSSSKLPEYFLDIFNTSKHLHFFLAAITLGIRPCSLLTRLIWSNLITVLEQDYIVAAHSRGISNYKIIAKYALNSVKVPIITLIAIDLGSLLTGAAITESIFALPGIGKFALDAIFRRDQPVIMGAVLFSASIFIFINFILDRLYPILDPRIQKISS